MQLAGRAPGRSGLRSDGCTGPSGPASPKGEQDPQASHLTTASEEERFGRLRAQGVDMARTWAQERRMDEQTQQGLLAKVERSALGAYREIKS
ncbi:hypothetical protein ACFCXH_07765 [Streptomyces nojiriensis]|uniref:hypothetical protein n=1 Tax=Streptomyces nojiriensis TaxID=66374 RepID=UPI0035DF92EE